MILYILLSYMVQSYYHPGNQNNREIHIKVTTILHADWTYSTDLRVHWDTLRNKGLHLSNHRRQFSPWNLLMKYITCYTFWIGHFFANKWVCLYKQSRLFRFYRTRKFLRVNQHTLTYDKVKVKVEWLFIFKLFILC